MDNSARRKIFVELKLGHGLNLLDLPPDFLAPKGSGWFVLKIFCSSISGFVGVLGYWTYVRPGDHGNVPWHILEPYPS